MSAGPLLIHPYLMAAHQILFSLAHNIAEVRVHKIFYPLLITLLITFLFLFVSERMRCGRSKSAAAGSIFWLLFFSYGPAEQLLISRLPSSAGFPFFLMWLVLAYFIMKKLSASSADFDKIGKIFNFTAAVMIILPLSNIFIFEYNSRANINARQVETQNKTGPASSTETPTALPSGASGGSPDIYHIVFDGYPRADVLKEIYGFDNSDFINYLKNKGFFVADKSYANYGTFTLHSAASYLNYSYYPEILEGDQRGARSHDGLVNLIQHNAAARFLRRLGYTFISYNTLDCVIYTADILMKPPEFRRGFLTDIYSDSFYNLLINKTPLAIYYKNVSRDFDFSLSEGLRTLCAYMFGTVSELGLRGGGPVFVYAHLPVPHPPFIFDDAGADFAGWKHFDSAFGDANLLVKNSAYRDKYIKFYINQVKFVNKKAVEMIEGIIKNSKEPPVIIIQSDHGPGSNFNFSDIHALTPRGLYERYAILNAYYFRGRAMNEAELKRTGLHERITPVNTYRVIFNEFFDAGLKMLTDECFYATDKFPYDFTGIEIK